MSTSDDDPFDLQRFVDAQAGVYPTVLAELRAGAKRSHWIWFVFPQLRGLGHSATAQRFGLGSLAEAQAYLAHPVLGPRLQECARLLVAHRGRTARQILGYPDDLKVRSSMTLFARAGGAPFLAEVLDAFYDGEPDPATLRLLG
ncbi:calpastatin [Mycobacterium sp. Soil538]|nr:calpastatin [Mycobacterium sp. Soil538]